MPNSSVTVSPAAPGRRRTRSPAHVRGPVSRWPPTNPYGRLTPANTARRGRPPPPAPPAPRAASRTTPDREHHQSGTSHGDRSSGAASDPAPSRRRPSPARPSRWPRSPSYVHSGREPRWRWSPPGPRTPARPLQSPGTGSDNSPSRTCWAAYGSCPASQRPRRGRRRQPSHVPASRHPPPPRRHSGAGRRDRFYQWYITGQRHIRIQSIADFDGDFSFECCAGFRRPRRQPYSLGPGPPAPREVSTPCEARMVVM